MIDQSQVYRDSAGHLFDTVANAVAATPNSASADRDTNGNPVPTYKAHAYTYDASGNLATDTVTDGASTWIRTYQTGPTGTTGDSGWVKQ